MGKNLVIVESPAKARTLSRILGGEYAVEASYGHVRDLPESADQIPAKVKKEPWARLGVNVEGGFEPLYVISQDKKKHIKKLREALRDAESLVLATDEDREGESISWHVVEVLKPSVPVQRIAFHEITDEAIHEALKHPRGIDDNLVRSQESRRILDRLFGYQLSPLLWKKVRTGLSAGRVQSVAVRLCVLRERDRARFKVAAYWDVEAELEKDGQAFTARLLRVGGDTVASGRDFDPETGELKKGSKALWLRGSEEVEELIAGWSTPWRVTSVEEKPLRRRPAPPFTTSTLQQAANRRLRFTARHTMRVAQRLYEGVELRGERVGLITYMRTDSMTLSRKALADAQRLIRSRYGDEYTDGPRQYRTRAKGAQEAHEAIRPTEVSRTPEMVKQYLNADEQRLYQLIWRRAVASQMSEARLRRTSVEITAPGSETAAEGIFGVTGTTVEFPGFLRVYSQGGDGRGKGDDEVVLPALEPEEECEPSAVNPKGHETQPPARYTEASLIKRLEQEGIGRPSTYASILDTIQRRGYVVKQGNALVPTFTACAVTRLLEEHFRDYVETTFTARMEEQLDEIADGQLDWRQHLRAFYFGDGEEPGLERRIEAEEPSIEYPSIELGEHPENGKSVEVRIGRYGPYLLSEDAEGERLSASVPEGTAPADLTLAKAVELLERATAGSQQLGTDPETGLPVYLCRGRYGPYVQLGEAPEKGSKEKPKRASLPKGVAEEEATLANALRWLSLPRTLGEHRDSGEPVVAASGRYGPFIRCGSETRSLPTEDDIYTVGLERALELLAQPKGRRRRSRKVLRELGKDAGGKAVQLLDGPYGPYLSNGELNASLPKGVSAEDLTPEEAVRLLKEKGKPPKRRRKRSR